MRGDEVVNQVARAVLTDFDPTSVRLLDMVVILRTCEDTIRFMLRNHRVELVKGLKVYMRWDPATATGQGVYAIPGFQGLRLVVEAPGIYWTS